MEPIPLKKIILCICAILYANITGFAQIQPPKQTDTLEIISVQYNYADIRQENWPCHFIYKSTTSFKIAGKEFRILDVDKYPIFISFILTDITGDTGKRYKLIYEEDSDSEDSYKTIRISFSGYEFTCRPFTTTHQDIDIQYVTESVSDSVTIEDDAIPFDFVEEKPSFKGGDADTFSKWVNERLIYPEIAKENGVSGRVTLQFTVNTDGAVKNVKVLRSADPSLDKEAVRVVSMSPKWTPGKQKGRAVNVTYTFPVIFQLR